MLLQKLGNTHTPVMHVAMCHHHTCKQPDMLLDGCTACPVCQGSALSGIHAGSYTAAGPAAS